MDYGLNIVFPAELRVFFFIIMSRLTLEHTQSPVQWVPGVGIKLTTHLCLELKLRMHGAFHLHSPCIFMA
jgi:hypothetical protein